MTNFHYARNTDEMIKQVAQLLNASNAIDYDVYAQNTGISHRAKIVVYNGQEHIFTFNAFADCEEFFGKRAAVMANKHASEIFRKALAKVIRF